MTPDPVPEDEDEEEVEVQEPGDISLRGEGLPAGCGFVLSLEALVAAAWLAITGSNIRGGGDPLGVLGAVCNLALFGPALVLGGLFNVLVLDTPGLRKYRRIAWRGLLLNALTVALFFYMSRDGHR
jgi:hypothetical protein